MNQSLKFEINKFENLPIFLTDRKKISDFTKVIDNLPKKSAIIIREYDLKQKEREKFALKIQKLAKERNIKIIIGKDINLAKKINANGIHISDYDKIPIKFLRKSSFPKDFIFSFATHSLKSVIFCNKIKPNMAFISPIFESSSHKNTKYLGNLNLAKIAFQKRKLIFYPLKLYSLGGINLKNIKKIIKSNSCGFGAIDLFKEK